MNAVGYRCPTCRAVPGDPCVNSKGRHAGRARSKYHQRRYHVSIRESRPHVFACDICHAESGTLGVARCYAHGEHQTCTRDACNRWKDKLGAMAPACVGLLTEEHRVLLALADDGTQGANRMVYLGGGLL